MKELYKVTEYVRKKKKPEKLDGFSILTHVL